MIMDQFDYYSNIIISSVGDPHCFSGGSGSFENKGGSRIYKTNKMQVNLNEINANSSGNKIIF